MEFKYFAITLGLILSCHLSLGAQGYYGTKIGALSQLHHAVKGDVYAVDSRTIFLKGFNYDGEGPAAYFYVGNSRHPSNNGAFRLRDERGNAGVIRRYRNKDITLSLPEGKTLRDFKWFSVWCDEFAVNFGDVTIPKTLEFPRPQKVASLSGVHEVSSDNIVIVDAQTLLIPNFSYDGEAPDAKFWVGRGPKPSPQGLRIPDENGKETPLRRYDKKTIVLTLPGDLTVFDIGHFGVWCEAFTVDFGHVRMPDNLNVPPSLKMLGISPQSKLNCEVLYDDLAFEVRWAVAGESVVIQLVAKLDDGEYMSFGVAPDISRSEMIGADVAVVWVDKETGKGYAHDYFLDAKSQCSGNRGSCPDTRIADNSNSIRLLNAAMVNGYSIVTFQRPLKASDRYDLPILTNGSQAIVWALGPLNQRYEVSFHSQYTKGDRFIDFGRQPIWNCPMPEGDNKDDESEEEESHEIKGTPQRPTQEELTANRRGSNNRQPQQSQSDRRTESIETVKRPVPTPKPASKNGAWDIPPIQCYEPEDGVFYAQMGPTGGKQGYPAITGHVGWGISWYINGLLIPEINVVRGKTYTFVVEGGNDPETPAKYHPFYISDDSVGGYEYKTEEEKANVRIYAGVHRSRNGVITPTGVGRLCNWTPDIDGPPADEYSSFGAYQRTLTLKCDEGEPGIITWTPDRNTPDTVYYHCFTHRYLGWKINVLDSCDEAQASEIDEVFIEPEALDSLVAQPSIRHESKLKPNDFLTLHEKDLIKNHNMNSAPPKIQVELQRNTEITKLIADGIKAAEALEESILKQSRYNATQTFHGPTTPPYKNININNKNPELYFKQDMELPPHYMKQPPQEEVISIDRPSLSNSGLPVFLRPPQHTAQIFRPPKYSQRKPIPERRPFNRPQRPFILPQPSMIVNHYKKPSATYIRPYNNKNKQVPIKPAIASILLLGEPTEIKPIRKIAPDMFQGKPQKPMLRVPYNDQQPAGSSSNFQLKKFEKTTNYSMQIEKQKQQMQQQAMQQQFLNKEIAKMDNVSPTQQYKLPYDTKEEEITYKPAINTGFQPDSVIVESGFKPIFRRREDKPDIDNTAVLSRRRDEYVSDIDEAMEGDALFLKQETPNKSFEPMFIPSPLDSTSRRDGVQRDRNKERLSGDLKDMDVEVGDDKMAVAAERHDTFYIPPTEMRRKGQVIPEGPLIAYDGKTVVDMSSINVTPVQSSIDSNREEIIRGSPKYGLLQSDNPQSSEIKVESNGPKYSNGHRPQTVLVNEYTNQFDSMTNLNIPTNQRPISTKLTLLKSSDTNISL